MDKGVALKVAAASTVAAGALGYAAFDKYLGIHGPLPAPDSKEHGGSLVASVLKAHGVEFVFTLCGGHISTILVGAKAAGIRIIDVRHEVNTVFAADGVSRLTGIPGVAAVTAGPGVTNTITAIKNAQLAQSPLILLGGAAATLSKNRGALQDVDQMSVMKSIVKWSATIVRVKDIVPVLKEAFAVAQSGVPGPVFVELPIDVLYPMSTVKKEIAPQGDPSKMSLAKKCVNWYLNRHIDMMFGGAFVPQDPSPLPVYIPKASESELSSVLKLIQGAKKPVLLVGSQALLPGSKKGAELAAAVVKLNMPTYLAGMARGLLGKDSPNFLRQRRSDALKTADVIVLAGVPVDFRLAYGRSLGARAKIVTINRSSSDLTLNENVFWKSTLKVLADPCDALIRLAAKAPSSEPWATWLAELRATDAKKEAENLEKANLSTEVNNNPIQVVFQMDNVLADNSVLVADGGDFVATAAYTVRPRGPLSWLDPGVFGTLGVGAGFALAAKLCRPEADVWIIYGDGAAGFSMMEFDTFVRHKLPVIAVIGNDACWSQILREQAEMFNDDVGCPLSFMDYHTVAKGCGGEGIVVKGQQSQQVIADAFQDALSISRKGKPVCLNIHIGTTDFRKGSISV